MSEMREGTVCTVDDEPPVSKPVRERKLYHAFAASPVSKRAGSVMTSTRPKSRFEHFTMPKVRGNVRNVSFRAPPTMIHQPRTGKSPKHPICTESVKMVPMSMPSAASMPTYCEMRTTSVIAMTRK